MRRRRTFLLPLFDVLFHDGRAWFEFLALLLCSSPAGLPRPSPALRFSPPDDWLSVPRCVVVARFVCVPTVPLLPACWCSEACGASAHSLPDDVVADDVCTLSLACRPCLQPPRPPAVCRGRRWPPRRCRSSRRTAWARSHSPHSTRVRHTTTGHTDNGQQPKRTGARGGHVCSRLAARCSFCSVSLSG